MVLALQAATSDLVERDAVERTPQLDYDVTIAGSGIVGLTLACALKASGLRVALLDAKPRTAGLHQRRAYAITLMSGRIFSGLGIWDQILPHITTFQQIRLADEDCAAVVNLQPEDLGTPELGYVGEHCVLVQALLDALEDAENLTWLSSAEVLHVNYQPDAAELTISIDGAQRQIRTRLLAAADGSRSSIRQGAGIGTQGWQYWQSCVTAVIRPEKSHENIAREHFWTSGPFATLPLPHNRCQIVLTAPHAEAQRLLEMSDADFLAELDRRYDGQLGKLELVSQRALFPVRLMQSRAYVQSRLALVGDAAHCCHPVGGQGLNLGIRDAAALAQVIQAAAQRGEEIGDLAVLKRYQRWRQIENLAILGFTDLLDRCFSNRWLPLVVLRRLGLQTMRNVRPLKGLALRLMTGLLGRQPELARR
ncbi:MAG: FAD-dependent hydroxylase [Cyanobacteria bacterium RM1_2_2]|nr:FAD-dependent hydroxylase [Cyanobacteria bacterium RM1_2_2]